ncbi:hypothetical protein Tco_0259492, partial [Tanacetum coccineum]
SAVEGSSLKGNGEKRKGLKAQNGKFSGHEMCLRSMGPFCVRSVVEGSSLKGNGGKRKAENGKFSGHEVYLRKTAQGEQDLRQSYLPYRMGIIGFFTNVNDGLSKNVHPY